MNIKIKNSLIAFLIILAIYQTFSLWFGNFSSHSFFLNLKNKTNILNLKNNLNYAIENITINTGSEKFLKQYENITKYEYKKSFDQAIFECLKKGTYTFKKIFDKNILLNNKCAIYNFSFKITPADLKEIFGIEIKKIPQNIVFDSIALIPKIMPQKKINVILYSSNNKEAHIFTLNKKNLTENIYYTLDNFSYFENKLFYYTYPKNNLNFFDETTLIPKSKQNLIPIKNIYFKNPLEQQGGILLSGLEKYIDIFFDNHAIKWDTTIDNIYTYKDDNTILKYYPNNVLEYINYKTTINKNTNPYKIALDFLKKDINIKNEYYLKKYEKNNNGYVFYFDYKINNFPISLSENIKNKTNMQSMIEITVSENKVYKYKRIIYDFYISKNASNWGVSFENAIKNLSKKLNIGLLKLKNINLSYNFNELNEIKLYWEIKLENKTYFESIEDNN